MPALPHSACPSWSLMGSSVPIPSAHTMTHVHVLCYRSESSGRKNKFVLGNTTPVRRAPVLRLACDWTQKAFGPRALQQHPLPVWGPQAGVRGAPSGVCAVSLILSEECCRRWRGPASPGPWWSHWPWYFPRRADLHWKLRFLLHSAPGRTALRLVSLEKVVQGVEVE